MIAFLTHLNTIWNTYPIEFIVFIITTCYAIFRIINDFLPTKYKINKRIMFLIKIEKVVCLIKVSIPVKKHINLNQLGKRFDSFWNENTSNVRETHLPLSFYSKLSGSAYEVNSIEDVEENKNFITLSNFNGFNIGAFGMIRNIDTAINEIQQITDLFNSDRCGKDKITVEISITPRLKKESKSKLNVENKEGNCSYVYNFKQIKIVNDGFSSLKQNISKTVYDWIDVFI
jgi:hypothetical protein